MNQSCFLDQHFHYSGEYLEVIKRCYAEWYLGNDAILYETTDESLSESSMVSYNESKYI